MSQPDDIYFRPVAKVAGELREGSLTPRILVETLIERARQLDRRLRSIITIAGGSALAEADAASDAVRRVAWRGPLHGIPIGIKDCIATAGLRTTANSRVLSDWVPSADAPAVAALRREGAIVFAKLNLNEFAWSIPSEDDPHPPPRNPWNPTSCAMGSSSGSAVAVASGLCFVALGTDAGGSIRQPAANCGVVGLKPTHGLVPVAGAMGPRAICEVGPIARTVEDAALVLDALTGGRDRYATSLRGRPHRVKVGVPRHHVEGASPDPEIAAAFDDSLRTLRELETEILDVRLEGLADAAAANFIVLNAEAFAAHEQMLRARMNDYGSSARLHHLQGAFLSAADYIAASRLGEQVRERLDSLFRQVDVLALPVTPVLTSEAARASGARPGMGGVAVYTAPFNLTGHPALALPCGISSVGIPVGLQLVGRANGEVDLLRLAHAYEQVTPWHTIHPAVGPADSDDDARFEADARLRGGTSRVRR